MKIYIETGTSPSKLTDVDRIAPWKGVMLHDYYQVTDFGGVTSGDFPLLYVGVAGGVTAAAVGGVAVYVFIVSKGSSAAATGVGSSAKGTGGGGSNDFRLVADSTDEKMKQIQINSLKSDIDKLKSNLFN